MVERKNIGHIIYRCAVHSKQTTEIFSQANFFILAGIFYDTFRKLDVVPDVIYPSLNTETFDRESAQNHLPLPLRNGQDAFWLLSINRYERKKNLPLALKTLGMLYFQ